MSQRCYIAGVFCYLTNGRKLRSTVPIDAINEQTPPQSVEVFVNSTVRTSRALLGRLPVAVETTFFCLFHVLHHRDPADAKVISDVLNSVAIPL